MNAPKLAVNEEIRFGFDELFFSRTDGSGLILAGNEVFQRVSIYSWEELIGKPHKIVRHPDTPRAVFWQLWHALKQNEPVAAYVKNRAKDGRFYWVFAIATPIEGGYLSARLRPSSELFSVVKAEYQALAARETLEKLAPGESATTLIARLAELGFPDYKAFMTAALSMELAARDAQLKRPRDHRMELFEELVAAAKTLLQRAADISDAYRKNEYVPLNFQVHAAQLGQGGAAMSAISTNYTTISGDIRASMTRFIASAEALLKAIQSGHFHVGVAKIQQELAAFFRSEAGQRDEGERLRLEQQQHAYTALAAAALDAISHQASAFRDDCTEMSRLASGLEVIRIMGKVECARHTLLKDGLADLLDELEVFQKAIAGGLRNLAQVNQLIGDRTRELLEWPRAAGARSAAAR